jgi:pSer/pThr/pTyr-binding forkhead associated (FHA) protein
MAMLYELNGDGVSVLEQEHLIGRGPQCALRLGKSYVSGQHAVIRWNGAAWELRDRGSRNGTRVNGELVEPGRAYLLVEGALLGFGHADEVWVLRDATPPEVMIVAVDTGDALLGRDGIIGLPSNEDPRCTVYRGLDGSWRLEHPDRPAVVLENGKVFEVADRAFRFCCPEFVGSTVTAEQVNESRQGTLHFAVSGDEEFVTLDLEYARHRVSLGSRSHNYLLLLLARARLKDKDAGVVESSCGWVYKEELADALKTSPEQIDGEVFRIRRHFGQHGLEEAACIIERRPRTKQLRIGIPRIVVSRA